MGRRGLPRARRGARLRDRARPRDAQPRRPRLRPAAGWRRRPARRSTSRATAGVDFPHEPLARRRRGRGRRGHDHRARDARATGPSTPPTWSRTRAAATSRGSCVTGDSLFVGDVARPDLAVDARGGRARPATRSLQAPARARTTSPRCGPGHIGGSLCGGAGMSEKPGTTIGFERRFNRLLAPRRRGRLRRELTRQPRRRSRRTSQRIVALNRGPLLTEAQPARRARARQRVRGSGSTPARRCSTAATRASTTRSTSPARINVTMVRAAVGTRAAWVVDPESEVVVAAETDEEARRMARLLEAVGFRAIAGLLAGGVAAWRDAGLAVESTPCDRRPRARRRGSAPATSRLLDVRDDGRVGGGPRRGLAATCPTTTSRDGIPDDLRNGGKPLAVACSVGNRSSIAVSLLRRARRRRRRPRRGRRRRRARRARASSSSGQAS